MVNNLSPRLIESDNDPLGYPWEKPAGPGVMDAKGVRCLLSKPDRRLSSALVVRHNEDNGSDDREWVSIQRDAYEHRRVEPDRRFLVVAVGSNASLEVMCNKFTRRGDNTSLYMPFAPVRVSNLRVAHTPFITARGYVPATAVHEAGYTESLWASWLDVGQMIALDSTEPGYTCRWLDASDYPIEVFGAGLLQDATEHPSGFYMYDADQGALRIGGDVTSLMGQVELFQRLSQVEGLEDIFLGDPRGVVGRLEDVGGIEVLRDRFEQLGMVAPTGIQGIAHRQVGERITYGDTQDVRLPSDAVGMVFRARRSRDQIDRAGEQCVVVCEDVAKKFKGHAELRAVYRDASGYVRSDRPGVVVKVIGAPDVEPGMIEIDQTLRDGLGVRLQELVRIRSAKVKVGLREWIGDALVKRRYLMVRAQISDYSNMETDIVLLEPQTMKMLGLDEGDTLVLEGGVDDNGEVRSVRMRVCSASDAIIERRKKLAAADPNHPFCSADIGLSVYPDLPWLFIDRAARDRLGITEGYLHALRVRASRRQKLVAEFRELMLVLAVALIGLVSVADSTLLIVSSFLVILVVTTGLSISKVRTKVGRGL